MEETALKELTRLQCPYTPKLYSLSEREQDLSMWVPGGWLILILIEKLPGQPPWNFWCETKDGPAMTLPQRNEVRTAFKEALS